MEFVDLTQRLFFEAHDLEQRVEDMPLYLHARVIPASWRREIVQHLAPILAQLQFCRGRVVNAWRLLLPPFDRANLLEFERRLEFFHQSVTLLTQALDESETQVTMAERDGAVAFLQRWYRSLLARRGFYTKTLRLSRHHRGLIPGMFDTIAGTSRLVVHRDAEHAELEYPATAVHGGRQHLFTTTTCTKK
ncbi:hypothetical protein PINS_up002800 [Pythium insidiosum]|nr:hypothetical protein PINS_up002800 [Pythium insidiosum]